MKSMNRKRVAEVVTGNHGCEHEIRGAKLKPLRDNYFRNTLRKLGLFQGQRHQADELVAKHGLLTRHERQTLGSLERWSLVNTRCEIIENNIAIETNIQNKKNDLADKKNTTYNERIKKQGLVDKGIFTAGYRYIGADDNDPNKFHNYVLQKPLHANKVFLTEDADGNQVVLKKADRNEAALHKRLNHNIKDHTVGFRGTFTIEGQTWIALDYCKSGSIAKAMSVLGSDNHFAKRHQQLQRRLIAKQRDSMGGWGKSPDGGNIRRGNTNAISGHRPPTQLTPKNVKKMKILMLGMAEAVAKLHSEGIVHRDVKPENFMIATDKNGTDHVVLGDFGTAGKNGERFTADVVPVDLPHYKDPCWAVKNVALKDRKIQEISIDKSVDMYSLGVSFYEMALDELPFDADFFVEVQNKMVEAKGSKDIFTSPHIGRLPEKDRDDFQDLIGSLMNMTPNGRMKASEIKGHPFFAELKPIAPAPQRPTA